MLIKKNHSMLSLAKYLCTCYFITSWLTEQINPFSCNALLTSIALHLVVLVSSVIGTFILPLTLHLPRRSGKGSPLTVLKL